MAIATFETPTPRHLFRRPTHPTGLWDWFTTIDHKKIGLLYLGTAFVFFVVGGLEALVIEIFGAAVTEKADADSPCVQHHRHGVELPGQRQRQKRRRHQRV